MFPAYTYMDPYRQTFPHQMEPNAYPYQYHPGWEAMPPQMKAESLKHPSCFAPYPFSDYMCRPNSVDHGGCCHHNCSPGYYSVRPQFSHVQPMPQLYYHGPYPPYPAPYPAHFVPPPHYPVDQARYDYDKVREHCCGCPNHTCGRRDNGSPKIEEQKPENEQDRESSSLIRLPNYPSPVWVPTSSVKGREGDKAAQLQPGCWNGWMPLDINRLHSSRQEDEGKECRQDEGKWSQKQSPFPIIWMPGCEKPAGQVTDSKDDTPKSVEDWPSKFKFIPLKLLESGNNGEKPKADHEEPKSPVQAEAPIQKESKIKTIPVKHIDAISKKAASTPEKQTTNDDEQKKKIVEKPRGESELNKTSEKKDSSPVRTSKLPPVCLRVDPLPRKKTNGTLKSPSPPGDNEKRNHQPKEEQSHRRETGVEVSEKVIPVVNEQDITRCQPNKENNCQGSVSVASLKDSSKDSSVHASAGLDEGLKANDAIGGGKMEGETASHEKMSEVETVSKQKVVDNGHTESSGSEEVKEKKSMKRDLSQPDAALIIQSAYRGYEVRRWRPLEKLRKIAKVRQQVGNVRKQIQSIEESSKLLDAKERMVIGETIMSLLLELDTVQGLHPSVREARKSVAGELVCLQEKLDSSVGQIAGEQKTMNVEVETNGTDEAAFVVSGADEQQSAEVESLDDKANSMGTAVTEAAAECDVNHIDLLSNEVVDGVASPVSREPTTEEESVQPAEDFRVEAGLSFGNQEADGSDTGTAIVANSFLASEPVSDQGTELSIATELPSGSVEPSNENGASESPSAESMISESKQETLDDTTTVGGPAAELDGHVSAPLLVGNIPFVRDGSSDAQLCASEEVSKLSPGEASPTFGVQDLSEPLQGSEYQEHEEAQSDLRDEGDANVHPKPEEPSAQTSEQGDDLGQTALLEDDGGNLASAEENMSEPELMSSPKQIEEEDHNAEEEAHMLLPVDGDINNVSCSKPVMEADTVEETMSENLDASGLAGVAENNGGLQGVAGVSESNEKESTLAIGLDEDSPAPGATGEEAPDRNGGDCHGLKNASAGMKGTEKLLLEENGKLREMLERLLDAGKEQMGVMSDLSGRVRDLERKLARRKRKLKVKRNRPAELLPSDVVSC